MTEDSRTHGDSFLRQRHQRLSSGLGPAGRSVRAGRVSGRRMELHSNAARWALVLWSTPDFVFEIPSNLYVTVSHPRLVPDNHPSRGQYTALFSPASLRKVLSFVKKSIRIVRKYDRHLRRDDLCHPEAPAVHDATSLRPSFRTSTGCRSRVVSCSPPESPLPWESWAADLYGAIDTPAPRLRAADFRGCGWLQQASGDARSTKKAARAPRRACPRLDRGSCVLARRSCSRRTGSAQTQSLASLPQGQGRPPRNMVAHPCSHPRKNALRSREDRHYLIDHAPVRRMAAGSRRPQGRKLRGRVERTCQWLDARPPCGQAPVPAPGLVRPAATEQRKAVSIFRSRPFFGAGPGRFRHPSRLSDSAHNDRVPPRRDCPASGLIPIVTACGVAWGNPQHRRPACRRHNPQKVPPGPCPVVPNKGIMRAYGG
jgi:hypothetical protein